MEWKRTTSFCKNMSPDMKNPIYTPVHRGFADTKGFTDYPVLGTGYRLVQGTRTPISTRFLVSTGSYRGNGSGATGSLLESHSMSNRSGHPKVWDPQLLDELLSHDPLPEIPGTAAIYLDSGLWLLTKPASTLTPIKSQLQLLKCLWLSWLLPVTVFLPPSIFCKLNLLGRDFTQDVHNSSCNGNTPKAQLFYL